MEFELIEKYFSKLSEIPNASAKSIASGQNLRDDAAIIHPANGFDLVVSKDMIAQGVHFTQDASPKNIAAKLLLSNLSDMAASGAQPIGYLLGFGGNVETDEKFIAEFCDSLKKIQEEYGVKLIGGDTIKTKAAMVFSITIFGEIEKDKILSRKNAKDADLIYVSGEIGDSFIGLKEILGEAKTKNRDYFLQKHFSPQARVNLGRELVKQNLSQCAIDVSDGLFADLRQICKSANLGAVIYKNQIPISQKAKESAFDVLDLASGGEDYELIFLVKKKDEEKIATLSKKLNLKLSCIGYVTKSQNGISLLDEENNAIKIEKYGYQH